MSMISKIGGLCLLAALGPRCMTPAVAQESDSWREDVVEARSEVWRIARAALDLQNEAIGRRSQATRSKDILALAEATVEVDTISALREFAVRIFDYFAYLQTAIELEKCQGRSHKEAAAELLASGAQLDIPPLELDLHERLLGPDGHAPASVKGYYEELIGYADEWSALLKSGAPDPTRSQAPGGSR